MTGGDTEKREAMTNTEALALEPGDRIQLRPQPTWATNPPGRTRYTVANAAQRYGIDCQAASIGESRLR